MVTEGKPVFHIPIPEGVEDKAYILGYNPSTGVHRMLRSHLNDNAQGFREARLHEKHDWLVEHAYAVASDFAEAADRSRAESTEAQKQEALKRAEAHKKGLEELARDGVIFHEASSVSPLLDRQG